MAGILSQQEIDSLLSGMKKGDEATDANPGTDREILPFDFQIPNRISKRQLQALNAVYTTFAEAFGSYLLSSLQARVSVSVTDVQQMFYSQYLASTTKPSCLYVFRMGESEAQGVLELSPSLVLAVIARMLGGTADPNLPPRSITKIEQNITRGIVLRALADMDRAWATIIDRKFELERYETEGDFLQIAPTSEIVLVVSFELTIDGQPYTMNICLPTFAFEDILAKLHVQHSAGVDSSPGHTESRVVVMKTLETTRLPLVCMLGDTTLTVQQLMNLEPGDVLLTDTTTTSDLRIELDGTTRALGKPGISNGRAAVKLTQILSDTTNQEEGQHGSN
ncbi:MAG: flagellar motor switch protein FliM [Bacteroidetes bacterium]|nr:flagellar motor switch protein FliM [Bacteroidota bacterium]MCW5895104.1 flagellar motor switch protein FliM [Bacteroidota bacterium]